MRPGGGGGSMTRQLSPFRGRGPAVVLDPRKPRATHSPQASSSRHGWLTGTKAARSAGALGGCVPDRAPAGGSWCLEKMHATVRTPTTSLRSAMWSTIGGFHVPIHCRAAGLRVAMMMVAGALQQSFCLTTQHLLRGWGRGGSDTPHPLLSDWANFSPGLRPMKNFLWRLRRKSVEAKTFLRRLQQLRVSWTRGSPLDPPPPFKENSACSPAASALPTLLNAVVIVASSLDCRV